jgi:hypothetical protein
LSATTRSLAVCVSLALRERAQAAGATLIANGAVFGRFGVRDVPTMIVVDPQGRISARIDDVSEHLPDQLAGVSRAPAPPPSR